MHERRVPLGEVLSIGYFSALTQYDVLHRRRSLNVHYSKFSKIENKFSRKNPLTTCIEWCLD